MNIILVGFMGTGKTVVGKKLAKRFKMEFIDLDDKIEETEGRTILEIFEQEGEIYFRRLEKQAVKDILGIGESHATLKDSVIATGGGVVLDDENIDNLKRIGIVICLTATPDAILKRTASETHRPLLKNVEPKKRIEEFLKYREPFYKKADYIIDTSYLEVDGVVEEILKSLKLDV